LRASVALRLTAQKYLDFRKILLFFEPAFSWFSLFGFFFISLFFLYFFLEPLQPNGSKGYRSLRQLI